MTSPDTLRRVLAGVLLLQILIAAPGTTAGAQLNQDSVVAGARQAIGTLRDSAALHAAGYNAIGFGQGVKDLTPFQGQHWIAGARFFANGAVELPKPTFLMYLPVGDSLIPIGVAYTRRIPADAALPADLTGVPAEWHSHVFCRNVPGEGNTLADGLDDCKERSGTPAPNQIAMVHTWTVPNPDGPYAHDNPALPYIATGLKPPATATRDDRLLGVALGETYGAKLVIAHRIELAAAKAGKGQSLAGHRAKLRDLAAQLRAAERAGDEAKMRALRKNLIDTYAALTAEYQALAPSAEMRARVGVELDQATGVVAHHHM
jgi:hypothetical protein